ncbi:5-(carboxyamino)imidazole ribonucleotide mutase [Pleionea sp. CnH1-48]|uniref:5-(carboxyamino)imidazole ribonucleotide mutase n=1 Tax=Pleionea sp. CnH1-48 TaxID=2954494 RepID=UPI0020982936|nr:5-(carboxyamino)imidazole ribonucleotide mutase [Pleionea sp. CnH1-48]MCO7222700.1 5-(carboxyamino)imidazole ribonucleotide mutase [Pleionea sp. CnH1-48]
MQQPKIAIIMGSQSDWPTLKHAADVLDSLKVPYTAQVVSAHRTPDRLYEFAKNAESNGYSAIIAGAGGAAHLPGMAAAMTVLPVIAVPVKSKTLNGIDSLLSIVQMPKGVAVATQAIGDAGAYNAGLMAAQIVGVSNQEVRERLHEFRNKQTESVVPEVKTCE